MTRPGDAPMVRVKALDWPDLQLLSNVLRKVGHDLNNAMVPAFGLTDLMRARHAATAAAGDIDRLAQRLIGLRDVAAAAVSHTLRTQHATPPPMGAIAAELGVVARQDRVRLNWRVQYQPCAEVLPGLDGHQSRVLMRALVSNAIQAHNAPGSTGPAADAVIDVGLALPLSGAASSVLVQDNGPGCSDFDGAAQGSGRRRGAGRLGIGLIVAASLAARGEGTLEIGPAAGGGFLARVSWPAAPAATT